MLTTGQASCQPACLSWMPLCHTYLLGHHLPTHHQHCNTHKLVEAEGCGWRTTKCCRVHTDGTSAVSEQTKGQKVKTLCKTRTSAPNHTATHPIESRLNAAGLAVEAACKSAAMPPTAQLLKASCAGQQPASQPGRIQGTSRAECCRFSGTFQIVRRRTPAKNPGI